MQQITLSEDQLNVVAAASDLVAVRDEQGKLRGYITMVIGSDTTAEMLARLNARSAP